MPSICLSLTSSAIFSSSAALFTWYGSSVTMIAVRSPRISSNATWARMTTRPRPWAYICRMASTVSHSPVSDVALLLEPEDRAAGREVRTDDVLAQVVGGELGVVDERDRRVDDLAQVVRRDVGGHADGDARAAVDQQVGELGRQDRRLLLGAVVVLDEVDGVLVDVGQQLGGDRGQARLRVAHRRGGSPSTEPKLPWPSTSG